jgi:hypothetical protein
MDYMMVFDFTYSLRWDNELIYEIVVESRMDLIALYPRGT